MATFERFEGYYYLDYQFNYEYDYEDDYVDERHIGEEFTDYIQCLFDSSSDEGCARAADVDPTNWTIEDIETMPGETLEILGACVDPYVADCKYLDPNYAEEWEEEANYNHIPEEYEEYIGCLFSIDNLGCAERASVDPRNWSMEELETMNNVTLAELGDCLGQLDNTTCWYAHPEYEDWGDECPNGDCSGQDTNPDYREIGDEWIPLIQCMFDADQDRCAYSAGI
jgi:hypothetical protein